MLNFQEQCHQKQQKKQEHVWQNVVHLDLIFPNLSDLTQGRFLQLSRTSPSDLCTFSKYRYIWWAKSQNAQGYLQGGVHIICFVRHHLVSKAHCFKNGWFFRFMKNEDLGNHIYVGTVNLIHCFDGSFLLKHQMVATKCRRFVDSVTSLRVFSFICFKIFIF